MNQFPCGLGQSFAVADQYVELIETEYRADGAIAPYGYSRSTITDQLPEVTYALHGGSLIRGRNHRLKFEFKWDLLVSAEKLYQFEGLYRQQQYLLEVGSFNFAIVLIDLRLAYLKHDSHDIVMNSFVPDAPTAPIGFQFIYPQFNIILQTFKPQWHYEGLFNLQMEGTEC